MKKPLSFNSLSIIATLIVGLTVGLTAVGCEIDIDGVQTPPTADPDGGAPDEDVAPPPDLCPPGLQECDGVCTDTLSSDTHCGHCGNECPTGELCQAGQCVPVCPFGQTLCDGGCHHLLFSHQHCGECGNRCEAGMQCVDGACELVCPIHMEACDGLCADLDTDSLNCGACDLACEVGLTCVAGSCVLVCPPGLSQCAGECVSLSNDPANCGECGQRCAPGRFCADGECVLHCPPGYDQCGDTCSNTQTDRFHCGECGNTCPAGMLCFGGECVISCLTGTVRCDDECANLLTDSQHCGECGHQCGQGQVCSSGQCITVCPEGMALCGNQCVDTSRDQYHCGDCSQPCEQGTFCQEGVCMLHCTEGQQQCGEECVNPLTDRMHCGDCDNICPDRMVCSDGECALSCGPGHTACNGTCVDVLDDNRHCGDCGNQCPPHLTCLNGECLLPCPVGFYDCGEGVCTNLSTSSTHCGGCGVACSSGAYCLDGECFRPVTGVFIAQGSVELFPGQEFALTANVQPGDASDPSLIWSTSAPSVVIVDSDGLLTGIQVGQASVTATSTSSGHFASVAVTVRTPVTSVTVEPGDLLLRPGKQGKLTARINPADADDQAVYWSSSNPLVASAEADGLVRAGMKDGVATITATTRDGNHQAHATVTVESIPVAGVEVSPVGATLIVGQEFQPQATVIPEDATDPSLIWVTTNQGVIQVNPLTGLAIAMSPGLAELLAITADGGHTASCLVRVIVPVTGISIEPRSLELDRGDIGHLQALISPENATNQEVLWISSDPAVATVEQDGTVTAVGEGSAAVSVLSMDNSYMDSVNVVVRVPLEAIHLEPDQLIVWIGDNSQLDLIFVPHDATNQGYVAHSNNPEVASVDGDLLVTAHSPGEAIITVVALDGLMAANAVVSVLPED